MDIIQGIFQSLNFVSSAGLRHDNYKYCKKKKGEWSVISGCNYSKKTKSKSKSKVSKKGGTKKKKQNKN